MKKIAFLFFLVSFCHIKPNCQQVTYQEAIAVAKSELRYTKGLFVEITDVHTFDSNGHTLLYEHHRPAETNQRIETTKINDYENQGNYINALLFFPV